MDNTCAAMKWHYWFTFEEERRQASVTVSIWARLDRDWQILCDDWNRQPIPQSWLVALPEQALPPATRADDMLNDVCELAGHSDDALATALVQLAQAGDETAGRVVLQAMLPRLWKISQRDPAHSLSEYISAAWVRLKTFPADTRRRAVMINLSLDCLKMLSRQDARLHRELASENLSSCKSAAEPLWGASCSTVGYVAQMLNLAVQRGLFSKRCAAVAHSVYCDGLSGREAALLHCISHDMVRYYCSKAKKVLQAKRAMLLETLGGPS